MTKLTNRVISVFDKKTSMRLAAKEWTAVDDICKREHIKRKRLFALIALNKDPKLGLDSSVRLFTITYMNNLILEYSPYPELTLKPSGFDYEKIYYTINSMS